jgi:membrane protease YdiL (CAAX protease family)
VRTSRWEQLLASSWLERLLAPALIDKVPRDHHEPDGAFRRRRIVVAVVTVLGATLLGVSLAVKPGAPAFYWLTFGLAAVWIVGGFASGPLHLGWISFRGSLRRPIITPIAFGLIATVIFVLGALVVREIGPLHRLVENVLDHAKFGSLPLLAVITASNGIAEEIFFRGAMFAAIGQRRPVVTSTLIYAVVTIASGNPMLVFAALTLGLVLALQRRASGGILAPILTHITWSLAMLFILPPLFS